MSFFNRVSFNRMLRGLIGTVAATCMSQVLALSPPIQVASCEYSIVSDWGAGFQGKVSVTNETADVLNGWQVEWVYSGNQSIDNAWNTSLSQSGQSIVATQAAWNGEIPPGGVVEFGFVGRYSGTNTVPELGGICSTPDPLRFVQLGVPFKFTQGETVYFDDLSRLSFLGIAMDSRCPEDVSCVWEGQVVANLRLEGASGSEIVRISTYDQALVRAGDYFITFTEVLYPEAGDLTNNAKQYVIELLVEKAPIKSVELGVPFTIEENETVSVDGTLLSFTEVLSDSRCPEPMLSNGACVWEGEVEAQFNFARNAMSSLFSLTSRTNKSTVDGGYLISFEETLAPQPPYLDEALILPPPKVEPYKLSMTISEYEDDLVSGRGVVLWSELEGGFFYIATETESYVPINLPEKFQRDNYPVTFTAHVLENQASIYQFGVMVELIEIIETGL